MDKSRFEHLVEKRMRKKQEAEKLDFSMLLEMMEQLGGLVPLNEVMTEADLPDDYIKLLPKFEISEGWGVKDQDSASARQQFRKYMKNVQGTDVGQKLTYLDTFIKQAGEPEEAEYGTDEILSNLMFLDLLSTVVNNFSPSGAGFLFEAFLAGLLDGTQMIEKTESGELDIDDLKDADDRPISLKLLVPTTNVKGSLKNIIGFLANPAANKDDNGIEYICVYKYGEGDTGVLGFYSFYIDHKNIFLWLEKSLKGIDVALCPAGFKYDAGQKKCVPDPQSPQTRIQERFEKIPAGPQGDAARKAEEERLKKLRTAQEENDKKVQMATLAGMSLPFDNRVALLNIINSDDAKAAAAILKSVAEKRKKKTYPYLFPQDVSTLNDEQLKTLIDRRKGLFDTIKNLKSIEANREKYENSKEWAKILAKNPTADIVAGYKKKAGYTDKQYDNEVAFYDAMSKGGDDLLPYYQMFARVRNAKGNIPVGTPKVSNLDAVRDALGQPEAIEGVKMMDDVAKEYKYKLKDEYLMGATKDALGNMSAEELRKLISYRRKLRDTLRKRVLPSDEKLGFFKNTMTTATYIGDSKQTVDDLIALYADTSKRDEWKQRMMALFQTQTVAEGIIFEDTAQTPAIATPDPTASIPVSAPKKDKTQFEIDSDMITKMRLPPAYRKTRLGELKIDREKMHAVAEEYKDVLKGNVINILRQLYLLNQNITNYFVGDQSDRTASGTAAENAARDLQRTIKAEVSGQKSTTRQPQKPEPKGPFTSTGGMVRGGRVKENKDKK
jgi:hypothetical protein